MFISQGRKRRLRKVKSIAPGSHSACHTGPQRTFQICVTALAASYCIHCLRRYLTSTGYCHCPPQRLQSLSIGYLRTHVHGRASKVSNPSCSAAVPAGLPEKSESPVLAEDTQGKFNFSLPGPEKGLGHIPVQVKHDKIPGGVPHLKLSCAQLALLWEGAWSSRRAILKFILQ